MTAQAIVTDRRARKRIATGFLWVYANELKTVKGFEPGQWVELVTEQGEFLACGTINPHSLIAVRILSRKRITPDKSFFVTRIRQAMAFRRSLVDLDNCRLLFAEGDRLPGFICDILGGRLASVQLNTAGAERLREPFLQALNEVTGGMPVLLKNQGMFRQSEGLDTVVEKIGNIPPEVEIRENGCSLLVPAAGGQKTGYYFDQRDNKRRFSTYGKGRVLDAFSYVGGFGLAAAAGAGQVTFVDSSATAIDYCRKNMTRNGYDHGEFLTGDGFDILAALIREGRRFDLVSVDPPAFAKSRKHLTKAVKAYTRLNRMALELLAPEGVLFTMSCSRIMDIAAFDDMIRQAVSASGIPVRIIGRLGQAADHPVNPAMKETEYLKGLVLKRTP